MPKKKKKRRKMQTLELPTIKVKIASQFQTIGVRVVYEGRNLLSFTIAEAGIIDT